jgi:hypothetical protein
VDLKKASEEESAMQANRTNVVVDVKQALSNEAGNELVSALCRADGVRQVRISPRVRRMVLVDYDATVISAQRILGTVTARGLDARLVGM